MKEQKEEHLIQMLKQRPKACQVFFLPKYPPIITAEPDIELKRSILKLFTVSPKFVFYKLIMTSVRYRNSYGVVIFIGIIFIH